MAVLWTILWVVLWIFIVIFALIGVIVSIVMFAPIFYRTHGRTSGEQKEIFVKLSWFCFGLIFEKRGEDAKCIIKIGPYKRAVQSQEFGVRTKRDEKREKAAKSPTSSVFETVQNLEIGEIISAIMELAKRTTRKIAPKTWYLRGVVGLSDPFLTSQAMALYEMLAGATGLREKVDIAGDYENLDVERFDLEWQAKGRFIMFSLTIDLIWFLTRKPIIAAIRTLLPSKEKDNTKGKKQGKNGAKKPTPATAES
ncbi:MAG: hypothetical protein FWG65_03380 [Turicibacter sp.]|nr:hypothetical protein [Turicibacter sp.]